ncbi:MarR family winged helix-turn-helix transcriptional regulator [Ideonella sp. B508-1]|uniref:MarR family winged helix-turn-helix transcriptional regulator n=1 Tax=Ideonella sp. B508-1 TaxID=137716 RepID=UPI000344A8C4|nr:MarR family winged helix-turn-helix transcriptional regulator [Ideonella sp. B508-1]
MGATEPLGTEARPSAAGEEGFVAQYLPALLTQAAAHLVGDFAEQVRDAGLSVLEWRVLATLADGGGPLPLGLLARSAATKQPTLTRLIDRMVQQGLVQREPDPSDRRQTLLCITPRGQATVGRLITLAQAHQRAQREHFGEARWQALMRLVRALVADQA